MLTLREMQPADSPAVKHLMENDPPSRGMATTTRFLVDPYEAWTTLRSDMIGVVIDAPDGDGVIGTATAAFEDIQFEERVLPSVNLENVKVHHAYRGRGLGAQLMLGLVERGRARFGDDAVILSGTITSNIASQATMNKWARQFVTRIVVSPRGPRSRPPRPLDSVSVRPADPGDFAEIAAKSNRYFADYNLGTPVIKCG